MYNKTFDNQLSNEKKNLKNTGWDKKKRDPDEWMWLDWMINAHSTSGYD